nr:SRPBCC domain-containing protein [Bacteroidota bacterium]
MEKELYYKKEITINASLDEVWNGLVNPEITKQYMFGCEAVSDWKSGSKLTWRGATDGIDYVIGNVLEFEPGQLLVYTVFDPNAGYTDTPSNYLTTRYELFAEGTKTILTVSQGDFAKVENGEKRFGDSQGGWEMALQGLRKAIEE